jgi:Zn-dependent protease with chaperone function
MYFWLGLCTSLALLLAVYTIASLLASLAGAWLERVSLRWNPRRRADLLFALRIAPSAGAICFVMFIAWPAYLAFEPHDTNETVGLKLAIVTSLVACGIAYSIYRVARAWNHSRRLAGEWLRTAQPASVDGVAIPVYRIDHAFPIVAVAGIFRPCLFIANHLFDSMQPAEIAAAVAHEMGHVAARDNLRRLVLCFIPDLRMLFGLRNPDALWMEASENAADLFAVGRSARSALDLASALIKVARATPVGMTVAFPPGMQLLASGSETGVAGRVHRLLNLSAQETTLAPDWSVEAKTLSAVVPLAGALIIFWSSAASLHAAHEALESFVRLLS